jgi:RecG-like helicase
MSLLNLRRPRTTVDPADETDAAPEPHGTPIADVRWRQHVRVIGRVRSLRVAPWADVPTLECTLVDGSGGITVVFLGRRQVAGIRLGTRMLVDGMAGAHHGKLAVLNPDYLLLDS